MERRDIMKALGLGAASLALSGCAARKSEVAGDQPDTRKHTAAGQGEIVKARKKAARKIRRIIMNNDGHDFNKIAPEAARTPETMLGGRTIGLIGTHVDSIFYCTGVFNSYTHRSTESELRTDEGKTDAIHFHELIRQGTDSLEVMTEFGHQHGLEVFWSMRMNDNHDATRAYYTSAKWKKDHPQYLMGSEGQELPVGNCKWSQVNYGLPRVRDKVFRILQDVATRYDVDGLELDFFRHPVFFKPQTVGEPVTREHCEMMTELLRRVRKMTEKVAARRGRPMLISARLPDSVGFNKAIGLDLIRWLEDDLIDILVGSGYFKLEPWENLAALGRKYGVPVYACLVSRRIIEGGEAEVETTFTALKRWRGEALNAWKSGVNGIYTFNRFDPHDQIFRELGDPELLKKLERIDQTKYAGEKGRGYSDPGSWVKGGRDFIRL